MAAGTGNLPNDGMVFNPFDILTAEEMNELVANIESLADGSGIGDGAVTAGKIDFTTLLPNLFTAFGTSIVSSSNPGTAGGTRNYIDIGGFLVQWGRTASQTNGPSSEFSRTVSFGKAFSSTPTVVAHIDVATGSVAGNIMIGTGLNTSGTTFVWRNANSTGPSVGGSVSWIAIGKG